MMETGRKGCADGSSESASAKIYRNDQVPQAGDA